MLTPTAQTAAGTNKINIDTQGANYATFRLLFDSEVNTDGVGPQIDIKHADVTDATSFVTISTQIAAHSLVNANELRYDVDLKGKKRYLRIETLAATHTTNDLFILAIHASLSRNDQEPATAAARNSSSNDTVVTVD
jgi:hypothetical protein